MAGDNFPVTTFSRSWKTYQDRLSVTVASLTAEQLALRAAPGLRSVGEIVLHIVGCRMFWLAGYLEEDGGDALQPYARWNEAALQSPFPSWNDVALALEAAVPTPAELARGLDDTWRFLAECLARWSPEDIRQTFPDVGDDGQPIEVSRAWVVWHILEHDLHHGGELSLTLGAHSIPAAFAV